MRISYNWLKRYIEIKISPEQLAEKLTSLGLEVESIEYLGKQYDGFVIGEVREVQKHPNADRLSVCKVLLSKKGEPQQIVCGASNVAAGQKVIVGLPGATVPKNQHDPNGKPFVLSKATIRGLESNGMICSAHELGLGDDKSGIMVLDGKANVGAPLAEYLGLNDVAFEIGITPNRPDCICHLGVARDLAAAVGKKVKRPKISLKEDKKVSIKKLASVRIENAEACPRYTARLIQNVKVQESPTWLKQLLNAAGLRSINNVVDVTNFILLEYGQPLHAFDYDMLAGHAIVVKNSIAGEKFTTLDGKTHELNGTDLMICDGEKPVALGGVMGGLNSEISNSTTNVLLESAYFSPKEVRRTAKRLGINTDASYRFERGADPNIVDEASARAASLITELSGGTIVSGVIDVYPKKISPKKITLRTERVNHLLGTEIPSSTIRSLLESIEIKVEKGKQKDTLVCKVPTFRPDIEQEADLIEEVARLYGYDNIPNVTTSEVVFSAPSKDEERIQQIRSWFESNGFNEIITNSLIDPSIASIFSEQLVKVKNPLSVELEVLRPSLMPTMLSSISYNFNHGVESIRMFEIGSVFNLEEKPEKSIYIQGYSEQVKLAVCISGIHHSNSWYQKSQESDIYDLKGVVESFLNKLALDNINLICYDAPSSLTEQTLGIEINGTYLGFIGKCSKEVLAKFKVEKDVFFGELSLEQLLKLHGERKFKEFSKFPTVVRDVAFIVDRNIPVKNLEETIRQAGGALVKAVTLFDIFEGGALGEGKKSTAFSLSINSYEKTLTDAEIDSVVKNVVTKVTETYGATLRSI